MTAVNKIFNYVIVAVLSIITLILGIFGIKYVTGGSKEVSGYDDIPLPAQVLESGPIPYGGASPQAIQYEYTDYDYDI